MKKISLFLFGSLLCLNACKNPCSGDNYGIFEQALFVVYEGKGNNNLFPSFGGKYDIRKVKIVEGQSPFRNLGGPSSNGDLSFNMLNGYTDAGLPLDTLHTRTYYLVLDETDTDTVRIDFVLKQGECASPVFQDFQFFYNNELSYREDGDRLPSPIKCYKK